MNRSRKKNFVIYSNDEILSQRLEKFKTEEQKLYQRILEALQLLGNFPTKIEVELYESKETEDENYSKLWCSDLEGNILIFYLESILKKDKAKIEKLTNDSHRIYDLSLAKKFKLTSENIDMIQTSKIFNFKFGRLITDSNSFYSLFLRDDIGYQIQGDLNANIVRELLSELNKLENLPKLTDYLNIFERILTAKDIQFSILSMSAFKDFKNLGSITISNEEVHQKKLTKNKES